MTLSRAFAFIAIVVFTSASVAQDSSKPSERLTFKSRVEAVTVATIVRDSSGKHIPELKAEDFAVYEEGKPQRIASVEEYLTTPTLSGMAETKDAYTNRLVSDGDRSRVTVILLDLLNANFADQAQARRQLARFLSQWDSEEPVALVVLSCEGLTVAHNFTHDPAILVTTLKRIATTAAYNAPDDKVAASSIGAESPLQQAFDDLFAHAVCGNGYARTASALQQIAKSLSGLAGRKSLIWLTAEAFLPSGRQAFANGVTSEAAALPKLDKVPDSDGEQGSGLRMERVRAYKALVDANIAVYPVDVKGLLSKGSANQSRINDLKDMAQATGGKAFYNSNDLIAGLHEAVEDSKSYYMLTYYRNAKDDRPGWRALKVKVNRPGADVRARTGFVVLGLTPPARTRAADLSLATYSALDLTGVRLDAKVRPPALVSGERRVEFTLQVPAAELTVDDSDGNHVLADWLVVVSRKGKMIANHGQTVNVRASEAELADLRANGLTYKSFVTLPEGGDYTLRFALRDGISGRIGTVTVPIRAIADTLRQ